MSEDYNQDLLSNAITKGQYLLAKEELKSCNPDNLVSAEKDVILDAIEIGEESISILLLIYLYQKDKLVKKNFDSYKKCAEKIEAYRFLEVLDLIENETEGSRDKIDSILIAIEGEEEYLNDSDAYKIMEEASASIMKMSCDVADKKFNTLLHKAAEGVDYRLPYAYALLGVPIDSQNKDGNTAIHIAAERNDYDMCVCLLQIGCNPFLKNKLGIMPKDIAAQNGCTDIVELFLRYEPGLAHGIDKNDYRAVIHSLRRWVNPLSIGKESDILRDAQHPITVAISSWMETLVFVHHLLANNTCGVKMLLRNACHCHKININVSHVDTHLTPLAVAIKNCNIILVKELLRFGASPDIRIDNSPLAIWALRQGCTMDLVLKLLGSRYNPRWMERDTQGHTVFLAAMQLGRPQEDIAKMLQVTENIVMADRIPSGEAARQYATAINRHDLDEVFQRELFNMFTSRSRKSKEIVMRLAVTFLGQENFQLGGEVGDLYQKFIQMLPKVEEQGMHLMEAAETGDMMALKSLNDASYIDKNGYTALIRAIIRDQYEVSEWLLAERPDLKLIGDINNRYPLHYAYALPDDIGTKYVRLILAKDPESVENLRDKNGLIPCNYRSMRDDQEIQEAIECVKCLDVYGNYREPIGPCKDLIVEPNDDNSRF